MKKYTLLGLIALALVASGQAKAEDRYVGGGFELSGHVDVVTAYQHSDKDAAAAGNLGGAIGEFRGNNGGRDGDDYETMIDSVELDIAKTFGEHIRLRADIDFASVNQSGRGPSSDGATAALEQAYVTVNVPIGNGGELLVGKFNAPIGFEPVDRPALLTVTHNNLYNFITPTNLTGFDFYYAFNDLVDIHLYIVNDLNDTVWAATAAGNTITVDSAMPSFGTRLGFTWGEEGSESTVGLSIAGGPEQSEAANQEGENQHWDYLGDVDFSLQVTDALLIGGEGGFRQSNLDDDDRAALLAAGITDDANSKIFGGMLLLDYRFSEAWAGTFRYDYVYDVNPAAQFTGVDEQIHGFTLAARYQITDGALFKMEYKFEFADPAGNANNSDYHSVAAEFAYTF